MAKSYKKDGDPFEKGDPVWLMNLNGKNRAGFYGGLGAAGTIFVGVGKSGKAGWWVDPVQTEMRHRFQGDGVQGDGPSEASSGKSVDYLDPLMK